MTSAPNSGGPPSDRPPTLAQRYTTRWTRILADATREALATDTEPTDHRKPMGTGVLLFLGLLWLALMVWITHITLSSGSDVGVVASAAALALPTLVTGALLAGSAAGLALAGYANGRSAMPLTPLRRLLFGLAAGAVAGVLAGAPVVFAYGTQPTILTLALTVAVAALVGGAAAALALSVLAAGLAAALAVLVEGVVAGQFQSPLKGVLGSGETVASQYESARSLVYLNGVAAGLLAAVIAYLYLRRRASSLMWPWFAFAGAFAGLLLLTGEVITQLGGADLFDRVRRLSAFDSVTLSYVENARLAHALLVFFVGAIGAMIAVGRTMRRPAEPADEAAADRSDAPEA
jgi:iron complex transport system permease protein